MERHICYLYMHMYIHVDINVCTYVDIPTCTWYKKASIIKILVLNTQFTIQVSCAPEQ